MGVNAPRPGLGGDKGSTWKQIRVKGIIDGTKGEEGVIRRHREIKEGLVVPRERTVVVAESKISMISVVISRTRARGRNGTDMGGSLWRQINAEGEG